MSPRLKARIAGVVYLICGMVIAGLAYQTFLSPPLAKYLFFSVVAPAGTLGELSLIAWLLVMGVNAQRWTEQADAVRMSAGRRPPAEPPRRAAR
jgi:hypothetical protein